MILANAGSAMKDKSKANIERIKERQKEERKRSVASDSMLQMSLA